MEPIVGKIAAIVTDRTVVINRGTKHGVQVGMTFTIQLQIPEISDPDNPEIRLSGVYYRKASLNIDTVYDNFSFASTQTIGTRSALDLTPMSEYLYPRSFGPLLSNEDWQIKVGDVVRQEISE